MFHMVHGPYPKDFQFILTFVLAPLSPTTKMTKNAAKQTPSKEAMNTTIPTSMITRQQGEHGEDGYQEAQHEGVRQ
jgi:hypothetical protein